MKIVGSDNRQRSRGVVPGLLRRAAAFLPAAVLLLSGCVKDPVSGFDPNGPDGDVGVDFRPGALTIAGASDGGDGWNTYGMKGIAGSSTRAGLPPTGMVEGAFQIGELWVDGNRGRSEEKPMTWAEATVYCQALGLRLPTYDEMLNDIVPYVRANDPLPDNRKFEYYLSNGTTHNYYWTSTPRSADASYVWAACLHPTRLDMDGMGAAEDYVSARCVKRDGELPPAPDPGPGVEHPDDLPVGTTFRVLVYEAGADPQAGSPIAENTYKVSDDQGTIVSTAVDEQGNATDGDTSEIVLRRGAYDFYYFSPAVAANVAMPNPGIYTGLTNGFDYMALAQRQVIDPSQGPKHYIPEVCFYRMGSYIDVRISPREGEILGTLEVTGDGLQLWGLPRSGRYEVGEYPYRLTVEGEGGIVEFSPGAFAAVEGATATVSTVDCGGGLAVLPGYASDLKVKVTLTSDGKELKLDASLPGYVFEPGYRYVMELGVGRIADKPELDITILPWNEYDWGEGEIGGGYLRSATVSPDGDIPVQGATYGITLEGVLPSSGVEVRASSGGEPLVSGKVTQSGETVSLAVPANRTGAARTVAFEYTWHGAWKTIASKTQPQFSVGDAVLGGVVCWVNPDNADDYRVVALHESPTELMWAASQNYILGLYSDARRNGADIWKVAKASSEGKLKGESGVFATDYPGFSYCYEKTDGGVPKGTWYLPSYPELVDLYNAKGTVEPVIIAGGGSAFQSAMYWSAGENGGWTVAALRFNFGNGGAGTNVKTEKSRICCVRSPLASDAAYVPGT